MAECLRCGKPGAESRTEAVLTYADVGGQSRLVLNRERLCPACIAHITKWWGTMISREKR